MRTLFVGNLAYEAAEADLEAAFAEVGPVRRVAIVRDHDTGASRGIAFVEMATAEAAERALAELQGSNATRSPCPPVRGRAPATGGDTIVVSESNAVLSAVVEVHPVLEGRVVVEPVLEGDVEIDLDLDEQAVA